MEIKPTHLYPDLADTVTISVCIIDARTGEPITGANIYLKSDRTNTTYSNTQGRGDLAVLASATAREELVVTAAGYERYVNWISGQEDTYLDISLHKRENKADRALQDHELVLMAIKGDQLAYSKLMQRYRDSIYFMIQKMVNNREDADDLTMEAFGKAFNNLPKYSPEFAFSTWLYRIAINNCIDFMRRKRLETLSIDEPTQEEDAQNIVPELENDELDPEETIIREQRIRLIRNVLDRLNPKYRQLIELRYLKEYSYEEISEIADLPLGTVKAQLFRAKELLYNILKNAKGKYW